MKKASVTALPYFGDCRRRWWFEQKYLPLSIPTEFFIGRLVHAGLAGYYEGNRSLDKALELFDAEVQAQMAEVNQRTTLWGEELRILEDAVDLSRGIVQNYTVYDSQEPLDGEVVMVEKLISLPVMETEFHLNGRVDLVLERSDGYWIVDHKTSRSRIPIQGLEVDEQLTAYAWMFWKTTGEVPRGVMYNTLIKSLPSEPLVLKSGKLSRDKAQPTVYDLYLQEIKARGLDVKEYQEYLDYLKMRGWTAFFQRDGSYRNLKELKSFEARALTKIREINQILEDPQVYAYPNPTTYRCSNCSYLAACKSMDDGGDPEAILQASFFSLI